MQVAFKDDSRTRDMCRRVFSIHTRIQRTLRLRTTQCPRKTEPTTYSAVESSDCLNHFAIRAVNIEWKIKFLIKFIYTNAVIFKSSSQGDYFKLFYGYISK